MLFRMEAQTLKDPDEQIESVISCIDWSLTFLYIQANRVKMWYGTKQIETII